MDMWEKLSEYLFLIFKYIKEQAKGMFGIIFRGVVLCIFYL